MARTTARAKVAIITPAWGESDDDSVTLVRMVAGALARHLDVEIFHLDRNGTSDDTRKDSVFNVHRFCVPLASRSEDRLLRLSLAGKHDAVLPEPIDRYLSGAALASSALLDRLDDVDPDSVLLCGTVHPYEVAFLHRKRRRRIAYLPMSERRSQLTSRFTNEVIDLADVVLCSHPGERKHLLELFPERASTIVALDLALSVNRGAAHDTLFGVRFFQPFVVILRRFPPSGERFSDTVTHETVTSVAGMFHRSELKERNWRFTEETTKEVLPLSVAEVDGESWRLSDNVNMLPLPVSATRVNLWRLMAHALFLIDLRPQSALARETLESFMFETPVIVPDNSAAKSYAERANAGLWYNNNGELLDAVRVLTDRQIRERFGENGRRYAEEHHGDMDKFVHRLVEVMNPG